MKLLIAADMEGITGVTRIEHTQSTHPEYLRFRRLMTADVNAAIRGAAETIKKTGAGVMDILVADGHAAASNILIEELDPRAHLNSGAPSPFAMLQGIHAGVDAVFFIGYHARMGTANAVLDHTWSSANVFNIWLNGKLVGEVGLNSAVCGHFGASVILVSGDQSVSAEAQEFIPGIETAIVKIAAGRLSAECLPLEATQTIIREASARAVERFLAGKAPLPVKTTRPINISIEFIYSDMADKATWMPGVTRVDGRRVEIQAADMPTAYRAARAAIALANR
jgi:D-amino peptidase